MYSFDPPFWSFAVFRVNGGAEHPYLKPKNLPGSKQNVISLDQTNQLIPIKVH